jgi:5-methylthioadenosine/S-adenosylhomocysteine deaminase
LNASFPEEQNMENGKLKLAALTIRLCLMTSICVWAGCSALAQEKVSLLVTNGRVITMDAQRHVIEDGEVAIRGDSIVAVGPRSEISLRYTASKTIDAHGVIVLPGLINGHAHAAMSLFRGIADDLSLNDWLQKYIFSG